MRSRAGGLFPFPPALVAAGFLISEKAPPFLPPGAKQGTFFGHFSSEPFFPGVWGRVFAFSPSPPPLPGSDGPLVECFHVQGPLSSLNRPRPIPSEMRPPLFLGRQGPFSPLLRRTFLFPVRARVRKMLS